MIGSFGKMTLPDPIVIDEENHFDGDIELDYCQDAQCPPPTPLVDNDHSPEHRFSFDGRDYGLFQTSVIDPSQDASEDTPSKSSFPWSPMRSSTSAAASAAVRNSVSDNLSDAVPDNGGAASNGTTGNQGVITQVGSTPLAGSPRALLVCAHPSAHGASLTAA